MFGIFRFPALLAALAVSLCMMTGARAENSFEVANIHVDGSGKSVAEARMAAIAAGRPIAWATLFRRITRHEDWTRQPQLDDAQLQKLVIGYFPANERRSTTRYVADVTYTFNPDGVARVLQAAGVPYASAAVKRILVIPMAPGFAPRSPWTMAFASPRFASAAVPFALPAGDSELSGLTFENASWDQVAAAAARLKATEAVLVLAQPGGNKMLLSLKRLAAGAAPTRITADVPMLQGAQATYPGAADAAVRAIDDLIKNGKVVDYSQKGRLTAEARFASLNQFANLENAIAAVPNVANVSVAAMDIGQARLSISYIGSSEQLRTALAAAGVVLSLRGGAWQISYGAP
jgi:hypothetical protein